MLPRRGWPWLFQLLGIGVNRREPADFRLYRPNGMDCYTFIHITTAAHFDLSIGGVDTEPDCCILYPRGCRTGMRPRRRLRQLLLPHRRRRALRPTAPLGHPCGRALCPAPERAHPRQLAQMERTALLQEPFYLDLLRGQTQCLMGPRRSTAHRRAPGGLHPYQQHLLEQFAPCGCILSTYACPWQGARWRRWRI